MKEPSCDNVNVPKDLAKYKARKLGMLSSEADAKPDDIWNQMLERVASARDQAAYAKLFDHYAPKIKSFGLQAFSRGGYSPLADELVQEVMIKVWRKSNQFDAGKASATTWIFTLARNTRIDMLRKIKRESLNLEADDLWPMEETEEDGLVNLQQKRLEKTVRDSIKTLPPEQAEVLNKVYLEGHSHSEVSESLGIPLGTVKSRIRLAMDKLKLKLER